MTASEDPPPRRLASPRPVAARARASLHVVSTSASPSLTMGADIRATPSPAGPADVGKAKRPLSHSHPQLTGSESTPIRRVISPELDWTATRQPTEHVVHVLHLLQVPGPGLEAVGRRGESADRADLHDVSAEIRRVRLPREGGHLGHVPALREVDEGVAGDLVRGATQRPHWMQRSRSRLTRSEMAIGFSQWRFSSTKRLSPGP